MPYKEIVVGIIVALLVVVGIAFREKIFHSVPEMPQSAPVGNEAATSSPPHAQNPENLLTPNQNQPAKPLSAYHGRPLDEIKFRPEILETMSGEHKDKLSANVRKYAKMVKETPEYTAAWLELALLKKAIGDYEGSRDIWLYKSVIHPHEATAFLNLGDLYTNYVKDYPKAEASYGGAIKADPKNVMGYLGLSDLYVFFLKEKKAQAEGVLKEGIAANPGDVNLAHALSRLYERNAK
ncbi:MAG: hypothetical protein HY007_03015 [Candidatus Sungbacteria bacterium]|nr:hypothetical protein [Candidatus Sungbacteria bacterium]